MSFTMKLTFYPYNTINLCKNESLCSPPNIHVITSALFYSTLFNWKVNNYIMLHLKKSVKSGAGEYFEFSRLVAAIPIAKLS